METERLRLRPLHVDDAPQVSALMTHEVSKWLTNFASPFSPDDAVERIRRVLQAEQDGKARVFALERTAEPGIIGWFATYKSRHTQIGVLGYWLGEPHQSAGYMSEAAALALRTAIVDLRLESVEAYIHPENVGSQALARKLGMSAEGEMLVHSASRGRDELCLRYVKLAKD